MSQPLSQRGRTLVKICGVRGVAAARAVRAAGADFAGLNLVPGRSRCVGVDEARALVAVLGPVPAVGVVLDQPLAEVEALARLIGLEWIQLHGDEPVEVAAQLAAAGFSVIRALRWDQLADSARIEAHVPHVAAFLVDGRAPGSGRAWWSNPDRARLGPALGGRPLLLAGGLHPDNVGQAVRALAPAGVDVASGIERDGQPDPAAIHRFVENARGRRVALGSHP